MVRQPPVNRYVHVTKTKLVKQHTRNASGLRLLVSRALHKTAEPGSAMTHLCPDSNVCGDDSGSVALARVIKQRCNQGLDHRQRLVADPFVLRVSDEMRSQKGILPSHWINTPSSAEACAWVGRGRVCVRSVYTLMYRRRTKSCISCSSDCLSGGWLSRSLACTRSASVH